MDVNHNSFETFYISAKYWDQTEIVWDLLNHESDAGISDCMFNGSEMELRLRFGAFQLPDVLYYKLSTISKRAYVALLEVKNWQELDKAKNLQLNRILKDFKTFEEGWENGKAIDRNSVLAWWLTPCWLAELLILQNETVLRWKGSNWWGIRTLSTIEDNGRNAIRAIYDRYFFTRNDNNHLIP